MAHAHKTGAYRVSVLLAEKENERVGRLVVLMVGSAWALTLVSAGMRNEVL